ncbi:MAG: response regulator, partial [Desulfonatronovibrio sp.]
IYHVLKVGILADNKFRAKRVMEKTGQSHDLAREQIARDDTLLHTWAEILDFGDPWDPSKYDLFIALHRKPVSEAVQAIIKYSTSSFVCKNNRSMKKAADFLLASQVELALAMEGHEVKVSAYGHEVVLMIPKNIILLHKFKDELVNIASKIPGVKKVSTELSDDFHKKDSSARGEPAQSKLLLVDDEREFVHTLSERLLMREIGSAVVYDGEQALAYVEEENPGVIVLDLKMPGIDGVEVLRRVKSAHPDIEIIILSGHGSREDKKKCLELGAAAYLEKPVDIDNLTSLLYKLQERKQGLR